MVSPFSFSIGDTTELEPYLHGGIAIQVKTTKTFSFVSIFFFLNIFLYRRVAGEKKTIKLLIEEILFFNLYAH